jgi:uncharacterized protein (TIGR02996 family)
MIQDAFRQAIRETPEDDAPRLIYADWLDDQNDPLLSARAEFIRIQCARGRLELDDERQSELQARERRLFVGHARAWGEGLDFSRFRRGFVERWDGPIPKEMRQAPIREVALDGGQTRELVADTSCLAGVRRLRFHSFDTWRHHHAAAVLPALLSSPHLGRLEALTIDQGGRPDPDLPQIFGADGRPLPESLCGLDALRVHPGGPSDVLVAALLASPLAETLTRLDLGATRVTAREVAALLGSPLWGRLTELSLSAVWDPGLGACRRLGAGLARSRLTRLHLAFEGGGGAVGETLIGALTRALSWGPLRHLALWNCRLPRDLRALVTCPHLAGLTGLFLHHTYLTRRQIHQLADCPHLANLTTLALHGDDTIGPTALKILLASPHLGRLTCLSVDHTVIGDEGLAIVAASPAAERLRVLDVRSARVSDAGLRTVADSQRLRCLTTLHVGWLHEAGDVGIVALAESPNLPRLTFLNLAMLRPSERAYRALLAAPFAWAGQTERYGTPQQWEDYQRRWVEMPAAGLEGDERFLSF